MVSGTTSNVLSKTTKKISFRVPENTSRRILDNNYLSYEIIFILSSLKKDISPIEVNELCGALRLFLIFSYAISSNKRIYDMYISPIYSMI
jgi:hypothetical protein